MRLDPESHARPLVWLGGLLAFGGLYSLTPWGYAVAALGGALLLLACTSRRDGVLLVGPFFDLEACRNARRGRAHLKRLAFLILVGLIVGDILLDVERSGDLGGPTARFGFSWARWALMAWFGLALPLAAAFVTAVGVAGVVAEERANRRWEVLLATDLRAREIVLGKVLGRAFGVGSLALAALPVVLVLGVYGLLPLEAIAPLAVIIFGAVLSLAGLCAGFGRRGLGLAVGYLFASSILTGVSSTPAWSWPWVPELVELANVANPAVTASLMLRFGALTDEALLAVLPAVARRFTAGSLVFFLAGVAAACRKLRADNRFRPAPTGRVRRGRLPGLRLLRAWVSQPRPPVTDEPLRWWAMGRIGWANRHPERTATWRSCAAWLLSLSAFLLACLGRDWLEQSLARPQPGDLLYYIPSGDFFVFVVCLGISLAFGFGLVSVIRRAATTIAAERSGDTFESLKLTTLTPRDVVGQVRDGAAARFRRIYWYLAMLPVALTITGYLPPSPALIPILYAGQFLAPTLASWAILMAARSTTPSRGLRNAVGLGIAGHYLLGIAVMGPLAIMQGIYEDYLKTWGLYRPYQPIEEVLWWDWLLLPQAVPEGVQSYRSQATERIVWPLGPALGLLVAVALVVGYVRLGGVLLRWAKVRLTRDWLPPPIAAGGSRAD